MKETKDDEERLAKMLSEYKKQLEKIREQRKVTNVH